MNWFEGKVIAQSGQRYTCLGSKPYTNRKGEEVAMIQWRGSCATCGGAFVTGFVEGGKSNFSRRCQKHKKPGLPARRVRA